MDGKLNRYVLDLIRRENLGFDDAVKQALSAKVSLEDIDFALDSLAMRNDSRARELLAQICGHHEADPKRTAHIRMTAAERLSRGYSEGTTFSEQMINGLHGMFFDVSPVRIAAYRACGQIADLRSIAPLKDRQKSETDQKAKRELESAVTALRTRLLASLPPTHDIKATLAWISHAADLSDGTLLDELRVYLFPPHSSQDVVLAALDTVGQIGNPAGVQLVREYIEGIAPAGSVLAKARRILMSLEHRNDTDLFEQLRRFLPEDSPALDPAINYESLLGSGNMRSAMKVLRDCVTQWDACHWDDFVTRMCGIFELMVRVIYSKAHHQMGLDENRRTRMIKDGQYANLIGCGEFKQAFPSFQASCQQVLIFRRDSPVAHASNPDGSEKPGVDEDDARLVRDHFAKSWVEFTQIVRKDGGSVSAPTP
jgi:hypothetical protein